MAKANKNKLKSMLQSASITISDTQIKDLAGTPVQIIPAQGTNKIIFIIGGSVTWNTENGSYTNIHADGVGYLQYKDGSGQASTLFKLQEGTTNRVSRLSQYTKNISNGGWPETQFCESDHYSNVSNKDVELYFDNPLGNLNGGDSANTLKVTVYYVVVDL